MKAYKLTNKRYSKLLHMQATGYVESVELLGVGYVDFAYLENFLSFRRLMVSLGGKEKQTIKLLESGDLQIDCIAEHGKTKHTKTFIITMDYPHLVMNA